MKVDAETLDLVSDRFLEAAIDPTLWKDVLEDLAVASGAFGVNIVPIGPVFSGIVATTDSLAPAMELYIGDEWYKRDFRVENAPLLSAEVAVEQDFATAEHFSSLDYYRAQEKFGLRWTAIMAMPADSGLVSFVLQRRIDQGPFEREEVALFRHVRRKLLASTLVMRELAGARIAGLSAGFETAGIACISFDRAGKVAGCNERASRLLGADLQITAGHLRCRRPADSAAFNERLRQVLGQGPSFVPGVADVIVVPRPDRRPLVIRLQRVGGGAQELFGAAAAVALIEDPEQARPIDTALLVTVFDLTPREAEIACMMASGAGLVGIGLHLDITYDTVRTHARAIFRKTDTGSQGQLIALLARFRF
ncbi:hypothetical protein VW29_07740 [Devosia limi DSM 17137]|uniref:DNA-binding transcriptional regulator, CsgD family n=1 Tax=Devosia limi DSM 17137 TaxID=1121477 RepID=A0A0F5LRR8_9HYPH|nr:LuxR C-terminal-related transcriptional regulator [Devosia limi]KKB85045.1 hypothetical protein VW29_07740 [Devosia limi DSM 17137]SHF38672.1 DNA-binding transcriptional regulator, CsgD family [Devosia limi DSM 17137]